MKEKGKEIERERGKEWKRKSHENIFTFHKIIIVNQKYKSDVFNTKAFYV